MVQVQEVVSTDTAPRAMAPGMLTPFPWPNWTARLRSLDVDGVRADYVQMDPYDIVVPPADERPGQPVRTMLVVVLEGISHGCIAGEELTLTPRQAALIDGRAAMSFHAPEPVRAVRLFVDHQELPHDVLLGAEAPFVRLPHTPLVTGCIGLIAGLLQVNNADLEPRDEHVVAQPLVSLMIGLLREALHERGVSTALLVQHGQAGRRVLIDSYIQEHLADRDLRVGKIAAALGVTARTIHGAYQHQGTTIAAHIRSQRVAAAQAFLAPRDEPPNIAALANRVGLTRDQLTRAFQDSTGMTVKQWWEHSRNDG